MRLHLGHHFYGAGNLGDDFMLAGFLRALQRLKLRATLTCNIPFALEPVRQRSPEIAWGPDDLALRRANIAAADAWLGLGGSPFQNSLSRWFIDHLLADAELCRAARVPMLYLGVGVQSAGELHGPELARLCQQSAGIWTRDRDSAARLKPISGSTPVAVGADLAHLTFADLPPPPAQRGRVAVVANFDYAGWPGRDACLRAIEGLAPSERIWLAQETRELPGAERALYAELPEHIRSRWQLALADLPGEPLPQVVARWPSAEWLVTSRFHAAIAGAWAGSKIVVIGINEKLRGIARELNVPLIAPDADEQAVADALQRAAPVSPPQALASVAFEACAACLRSAVAPHG